MPKACNLKRNNVVRIEGQIYKVKQIFAQTPSARGGATLYKVRFAQIQTQQKLDKVYKGEDQIEDVDLDKKTIQYLYSDSDTYTFMTMDDYSQHTLTKEELEGQFQWLSDGQEDIDAIFLDGNILGIVVPHTVELEIVETAPALKGASATARTKPATLSTGAEIQVPEYMAQGETVKVNTETGKFISRV